MPKGRIVHSPLANVGGCVLEHELVYIL